MEAEAERIEAEGWGKLREAATGSEAEGLYGLLRGVSSSFHPLPSTPLPSQPHISPSPSVHSQPPQEPTQPETLDPVGPATMPAPVAATPATGDDIPADMQPLRIQLGGAKRVYQCQVEGCKEGPSTSRALLSAPTSGECTWVWGWCAPFAINPSSTRMPLGITKRDTDSGK